MLYMHTPMVESRNIMKIILLFTLKIPRKADNAESPALPRAHNSSLWLHPWTPWSCSILGFCSPGCLQTGNTTGGIIPAKKKNCQDNTVRNDLHFAVTSIGEENYISMAEITLTWRFYWDNCTDGITFSFFRCYTQFFQVLYTGSKQ